jgi:hypothetical protein
MCRRFFSHRPRQSFYMLHFAAQSVLYVFKTQRTPNSVVFSFRLGKGLFSKDFIRFRDNKVQFWPTRLHITKKRGQNETNPPLQCMSTVLPASLVLSDSYPAFFLPIATTSNKNF